MMNIKEIKEMMQAQNLTSMEFNWGSTFTIVVVKDSKMKLCAPKEYYDEEEVLVIRDILNDFFPKEK